MFYVYEWYIIDTQEVIYVGKGSLKRMAEKSRRNKLFVELTKRFKCDKRIVCSFKIEDEAFEFEEKRIYEMKLMNQCVCNQNFGGNGGVRKNNWTHEMKKRMSEKNPMKDENQRKRMSINNPMKNADQKKRMSINNPMKNSDIARIVGEKHRKPIIINGEKFESVRKAALNFKVTESAICYWLKNGKNKYGHICEYDNQQPSGGNL